MKREILLMLVILIYTGAILRAQNLILIDDASGVILTEDEKGQIELIVDNFLADLPDSAQMEFKVLIGGLYLLQDFYQGGYPDETVKMIEWAEGAHPFHLLIIKYIHHQSGELYWNIFINLPDEGVYLCKNVADIDIIGDKIKQKLIGKTSLPNVLQSAFQELGGYINGLVECCQEDSRESCELLCLSPSFEFGDYLGKLEFQQDEIDLVSGSYLSTSNVIVNSQLKIDSDEDFIYKLQSLIEFEFGPESSKKIYVLDKFSVCQISLSDYLIDKDVFAVIVLEDNEIGADVVYSYVNIPCFVAVSGGIATFLATAGADDFEEFLWWISYFKEHTNLHPSLHVQVAIYKTCVSTPLHGILNVAGFFCDLCDLVDGAVYALEGDYFSASLSMVAVTPFIGSTLKYTYLSTVKITGVSGRKISLYFVKNGARYFGRSAQLATVIGKQAGKAAHHLIPWNLFQNLDKYPGLKKLVEAGFHPNQLENGMHLPVKIKSQNWAGEVSEHTFHGHHPAYDKYVRNEINDLSLAHGDNISAFYNGVVADLIPDLRNKIVIAENLIKNNPSWHGKNLNDYFETLIP